MQIEALINQNPVISKDLSLWNTQGSQVLRGQILVLPIDNTFLFVAPIYIQAAQARMPQLERVVLAKGSELVYADTYQDALKQLATLQGENPLVRPYVDGGTIAEVIAGWNGIPVGKMLKDEIQTVLKLKNLLAERVVGQDHALQAISQRIQTARAGLDDPQRPVVCLDETSKQ